MEKVGELTHTKEVNIYIYIYYCGGKLTSIEELLEKINK